MSHIIDRKTLAFIHTALNERARPVNSSTAERMFERFVKNGWTLEHELEDLFFGIEPRLAKPAFDVKALSLSLKINWESITHRPRARSNGAMMFDALRAENTAFLLIQLERLGFNLDVTPLTDSLLPVIKRKSMLSSAELEVFWYRKQRHRCAPFVLRTEDWRKVENSETVQQANGYSAQVGLDSDNQPVVITVNAPKYRRRREPVETVCTDCGHTYFRGDPDSSASHRREHRRRMIYLDPQPLEAMLEERNRGGDPELVTSKSPRWKHHEMYERALAFKREFRYDFIQWDDPDRDPHVHGFLFTNDAGAIVGACAFRRRSDEQGHTFWGLQWIWICPRERRNGHLIRRWHMLRERFGDFAVEAPVSDAMQAFLRKCGDAHLVEGSLGKSAARE